MKNMVPGENKKRILIIDDEKDICVYLKSILERTRKFEVYASCDPREGISLARQKHPDLVILDIVMPQMSGGDVANCLKSDSQTKDIPVAFFTVLTDEEEIRQNGGIIGGYPFIPKLITKEKFIARLDSLFKKKQCLHH